MGATPEELKEQIDQTRADLAVTVDALADKVTPGRTARRAGALGIGALLLLVMVSKVRARR